MKRFVTFLAITTMLRVVSASAPTAYADTNCQSIYGGGENCGSGNITVEKLVLNPTTNQYVNNLGTNDPAYKPLSPIFFKIIVKNTSTTNLNNITVNDTICSGVKKTCQNPEFVDFVSGPGNFNTSTETLTYTIASLPAGQENDVIIAGRTVAAVNLPVNTTLVCPTNTVQVTMINSQPTEATSEFCIQTTQNIPANTNQPAQSTTKGGLPVYNQTTNFPVYSPSGNVKNTPSTGPETLPLLAMIPTGGLGFWLRKKAK
jgi:uncharacterized repeat protein (TIGR01451 family)